jgi:hypothetical protein
VLDALGGCEAVTFRRTATEEPQVQAGWQVSDYQHPYPDGTAAVVLVDAFATGKPECVR